MHGSLVSSRTRHVRDASESRSPLDAYTTATCPPLDAAAVYTPTVTAAFLGCRSTGVDRELVWQIPVSWAGLSDAATLPSHHVVCAYRWRVSRLGRRRARLSSRAAAAATVTTGCCLRRGCGRCLVCERAGSRASGWEGARAMHAAGPRSISMSLSLIGDGCDTVHRPPWSPRPTLAACSLLPRLPARPSQSSSSISPCLSLACAAAESTRTASRSGSRAGTAQVARTCACAASGAAARRARCGCGTGTSARSKSTCAESVSGSAR